MSCSNTYMVDAPRANCPTLRNQVLVRYPSDLGFWQVLRQMMSVCFNTIPNSVTCESSTKAFYVFPHSGLSLAKRSIFSTRDSRYRDRRAI